MANIRNVEQTAEIRKKVFVAATKLFIEKGYEHTTVKEISKLGYDKIYTNKNTRIKLHQKELPKNKKYFKKYLLFLSLCYNDCSFSKG